MVNPSAVRHYGYSSADEMMRIPAASLYRYPEERQEMLKQLQERGYIVDYVGEALRKDGSSFPVSMSVRFITDNQGTVQGTEAIVRDITERKMMEHSLQEANRKLNLLNSITRHDVTNHVSVLRGFAKIAQMKKPDPVVCDLLGKIDAEGSVIARLVAFTKAYQELGVGAPVWSRIDEIVAKAGSIPIQFSNTCRGAEIYADPMLERVFSNLFDNSVRHSGGASEISVRCERAPNGLTLIVEDNGIGIPLEEKVKIFEKGYGQHTGFGLFLAREILAITGITIKETGIPGKGARFEMLVPKNAVRLIS
jgi:PAS domain S-box-containing protein